MKVQTQLKMKRCPRCNARMNEHAPSCIDCGLNFSKLDKATNLEAKRAFHMHEKERVVYVTKLPSDLRKAALLIWCAFVGLFGAHQFVIGKYFKGLFYAFFTLMANVLAILDVLGIAHTNFFETVTHIVYLVWVVILVLWLTDLFNIIFNRFKVPVSLPYED